MGAGRLDDVRHRRAGPVPGRREPRWLCRGVEILQAVRLADRDHRVRRLRLRGRDGRGQHRYDIIDWEADPPRLNGDYVRSEETQAEYITTMLDLFANEGMHGAFVYTFLESSPYSPDPRYDFDMACYGVVKIFPEETGQGYIATGYWEPNLAFHEIARRYGGDER